MNSREWHACMVLIALCTILCTACGAAGPDFTESLQATSDEETADSALATLQEALAADPSTFLPDATLLESVRSEMGSPSMLVLDVTKPSASHTAKSEGILYGTAEADAAIQEGINDLLTQVEGLGIDLSALRTAFSDTLFHEEGAQSGGVMVPDTGLASSVSLTLDQTWRAGLQGFTFVIVYDGHSHTIFRHADAVALRNGETISDHTLTTAGTNALHELTHIMLKQQHLDAYDDRNDEMVAKLEWTLVNAINIALALESGNTPDATDVQLLQMNLERVQALEGGEACLEKLGLLEFADSLHYCPETGQLFTDDVQK